MEITQLQYFVTTVQVGSITRAAEVLYITQPALSRTLRRMESELGFSLFERKHSGLLLTPAGKLMYDGAEQMLTCLEETVRSAKQAAGVEDDTISVACAFEEFDNQLIYQFQQHYPSIRTRFSILPPKQALEQLVSGEAGFALLPQMILPDTIKWVPLLEEEMLLSVGKQHRLYGRSKVAAKELDGCTIVCNDVSFDEDTLRGICKQQNIHLNYSFRGNDHHQVGALKHLLNSMMFIPASALVETRALSQEGMVRYGVPETPARVEPPVFRRTIGLAFHQNRVLRSADLYLIANLKNHYQEVTQQVEDYLKNLNL
jgi:DNA-binding transcriptional LysR family regulator